MRYWLTICRFPVFCVPVINRATWVDRFRSRPAWGSALSLPNTLRHRNIILVPEKTGYMRKRYDAAYLCPRSAIFVPQQNTGKETPRWCGVELPLAEGNVCGHMLLQLIATMKFEYLFENGRSPFPEHVAWQI